MAKIEAGKKRLSVWVPVDVHAKAQYLANVSGLSLQEFVAEAMQERIEREWKYKG